ncbi:MAG TPA: hypothetical protein VGL99_23185, partial [Chloroflexota bacterium]
MAQSDAPSAATPEDAQVEEPTALSPTQEPPPVDAVGAVVTLTNNTARRIAIEPHAGREPTRAGLLVPPFVTLTLTQEVVDGLAVAEWQRRGLIRVSKLEPTNEPTTFDVLKQWAGVAGTVLPVLAVVVFLGAIFLSQLPTSTVDLSGLMSPTVLAVPGVLFVVGIALALDRWLKVPVLSGARKTIDAFSRPFGVFLLMLIPVALVVIYLSVAGFFSASGLTDIDYFLIFAIQYIFIAIATLAPAYPYFIFQARKVDELRIAFTHDVMMLDPAVFTLEEASSRYSQQVDAVYGTGVGARGLFGSNLPVLVTSILIFMGWLLTLPVNIGSAGPLAPARTALVFGFLGAYFFVLNMVFRRYVRNDLSVKTYNYAIVRILVAFLVVWVATSVVSGNPPQLLAAAFLIGVVPDTGVALIQDMAKRLFARFASVLDEERPLSELRGMNIYDQARFLEEGIEDIENLAHYDLIPLMLRMRMPTPRLIDLVDQAILSLHLSNDSNRREAEIRVLNETLGVSTATGLEAAEMRAVAVGPREHERFLNLLADPDARQ